MDPDWPEAYQLLRAAEESIELGDIDAGMKLCREAAKLAPEDDRIWLSYGWIASRLDRLDEAKTAMQRAVELDPEDAANWLGYGYALSELCEHAEAIKAYSKVVDAEEHEEIQALSCLALSLAHVGRVEEAIEATRAALEKSGDDPELHERILLRAASTAEVVLGRAELKLETGDPVRALEIGRQALQLSQDGYTYYSFGVLARQAGALVEGRDALLKACEDQPAEHQLWFSLGNSHRSLGMLQEAIDCYRHSLLLEPKDIETMNNLGLTLRDLYRYQEAEEVLLRAIVFEPDDPMLHHNLGNVFLETGREEEALRAFREAERIDPYYEPGLEVLASTLVDMGKPQEAAIIRERIDLIHRMETEPPLGLA